MDLGAPASATFGRVARSGMCVAAALVFALAVPLTFRVVASSGLDWIADGPIDVHIERGLSAVRIRTFSSLARPELTMEAPSDQPELLDPVLVERALTEARLRTGLFDLPQVPFRVRFADPSRATSGGFFGSPAWPALLPGGAPRIVVRPGKPGEMQETLVHELTHALIYARYGNVFVPIEEALAYWADSDDSQIASCAALPRLDLDDPHRAGPASEGVFVIAERSGGVAAVHDLFAQLAAETWTTTTWRAYLERTYGCP